MKKKPKNLIKAGRSMGFVMLVMTAGLVLCMYTVERIKYSKEQSIYDYKNVVFDRIYSELNLLHKQAKNSAVNIASDIESDLKQLNLDKIQNDLDRGNTNSDLYNTIRNNIDGKSLNDIDNYKNGVTVMTQEGVFEDFNYERASAKLRIWEDEIDKAWNKDLEREAIDRLLIHSKKLIAMEKINHLNDKHIRIPELTEANLRKVYFNEGMDGLQNYQFKAAAYITETGDIFGNEDIVGGVKQKTHKFIIIQEFNLYDQLKALSPDLFKTDDHISYIENDFSITVSVAYIMGMLYLIGNILLLFYFSHTYNDQIKNSNKDE